MEQHKTSRNKLKHKWSINLLQRSQKYKMWKGQSSINGVRKTVQHIQKNKLGTLSYTLH